MTQEAQMQADGLGQSLSPPDVAKGGWSAAQREWRQHWRVGLGAFLALGLSFAAFQGVASLFVLPLQTEFGWSRSDVAFANNALLATALISPILGRIIDRFGTRWIMLRGMALTALIYFGLAAMTGELALFYALYTAAAIVGLSASGLTCSRVISHTFVASRGFSLAAARSGLALTSAFFPALLFAVISHAGWRAGYAMQGFLILLVAWPAVFFWIGRHGSPEGQGRPATAPPPPRLRELLSDRRIWWLCLGASLGYAPANAIMSQIHPLLVSKGIDATTAASMVGLTGIASFIGAIVTGCLVDRFWAPAVAFVFAAGSATGCVLLGQGGAIEGTQATLAILVIGLGLGAEIDIVAFLVARFFGVQNFSTLYGLTVFCLTLAGAIGASLLGVAFDHYGNYDLAMLVTSGCFVAAGFAYLLMGRYPTRANS